MYKNYFRYGFLTLTLIIFLRMPSYSDWGWEFDLYLERMSLGKDIPSELIKAVIKVESDFRMSAVSPRGAVGFMQIMPATAKMLGVVDINNPFDNIKGGVQYLRILLDRFSQNIPLALAAYNAGTSAVRKYGGIPPFPETKRYIFKVLNYYDIYKRKHKESGILTFAILKNDK